MPTHTISVVLATFNEEKNLSACLESVKDLADEIIIVDGASTDQTVTIARSFNAQVHIAENVKNFHINKQKAIDKASKEWTLQLDADERVTPALAEEIRQVIQTNTLQGYWIPRKNWFLGRYLMKGGVYPDYTMRLYRNGKGRLPQHDVHEQTVVEGEVGYLTQPLIHFADPNFSRYLIRFDRYTDFIAGQYTDQKTGKNLFTMIKYTLLLPVWWFFLMYVRHKGFLDSWQGLVFAFFSAMRFPVSYMKFIRRS